ncbi:MAG: hypothetical protein H0W86_07240 [Armatimonadetes bacterium]|nr:hypothetical protein [Armatimonadota bacterium]
MEIESVIGVLTGFGLVVVVPLVAIMLAHQRRMAALIHGDQGQNSKLAERIDRLQVEVEELRGLVTDQVLRIDDQRARVNRLGQGDER